MGCRGVNCYYLKEYIAGITGPFEKHKIIAFVRYYVRIWGENQ